MEITMLGTGNALVTECYNTCFLLREGEKSLLVDAGGGNTILRQLKRVGVDWKTVRDIFVTHRHLDHITGVFWLIRMICQHMRQGEYEGDATIYSHKEVIDILRETAKRLLSPKDTAFLDSRLHLIAVTDGETREIIGHPFTFFDIHSTKAAQFGFSVSYRDGKRLTCCGDEPYTPFAAPYAAQSTWLLHEAFCLHREADLFHPYEKHHSTAYDAALLAEKLQVENLLLYHTEDKNLARRKELYREEAEKSFHGKVFVPEDLETISL